MVKNCPINFVILTDLCAIIQIKLILHQRIYLNRGKNMTYVRNLFTLFNKLSLKTQLAIITITTFSLIISSLILFTYQSNSSTIINQQTEQMLRLVDLETQNLKSYIDEIDYFSLQPRFNSDFMQILVSKNTNMEYRDLAITQNMLKSLFVSRNDLSKFRLFLVNKSINLQIDSSTQKTQIFTGDPKELLTNYDIFTSFQHFRDIKPAVDPAGFITFFRTIINIEDQKPLAIVELTLNQSFMSTSYDDYHDKEDLLYVIDKDKNVLYSSFDNFLIHQEVDSYVFTQSESSGHQILAIDNIRYLIVYHKIDSPELILIALRPLSTIDGQLTRTRNISFIIAFLAILSSTILMITFIHLVTRPLSTLSDHLHKVGKGDFESTVAISGSQEIAYLAENYNQMIHQIDQLIKKTYISELNEKTARLIALEAQLNPHFLYNTLQVISAEAVVNGQEQINYMVTALASMLRYSIKQGDFVSLSAEVKHVKDYLLLQKARFEENLTYSMEIDETALNISVPKISIQLLVENSIIHGVKEDKSSIDITIRGFVENNHLKIMVKDNGIGMTSEQLEELTMLLSNQEISDSNAKIGLKNLSDRLTMLYEKEATISIKSQYQNGTIITLEIPIKKEQNSCSNV